MAHRKSRTTHGSRLDSASTVALTSIMSGDILLHPQDISWADVLARHLPAPFKPYISDELDVGNFSDEFTAQDPVDSPAQPPTKHADIFRVWVPLSSLCIQYNPSFLSPPILFFSFPLLSSFLSPRATLSLLLQFCSPTMCLPSPMEGQMVSQTHSR